MLICGIDDAGRGSVLGPLVIAGISIEKKKIKQLTALGVKDSKQVSPKTREKIYHEIITLVESYHVIFIPPKKIDASVEKKQLNQLEANNMAKVVKKLEAASSYVDSCDVNPKRFGIYISEIAKTGKIISSHHADEKFPVVSAASIVAKVNRDRAIEKLRIEYDIGSGYPSDQKTMRFIKEWYHENGTVPTFVRKSWKPVKILMSHA